MTRFRDDLDGLLDELKANPPSGNGSESDGPSADDADDQEEIPKRSQATELVQLATDRYRLGWSEDRRPHAVARDGLNVARGLRGGRGLRTELANAYYLAHGKVPSSTALADALAVLEGQARELSVNQWHSGWAVTLVASCSIWVTRPAVAPSSRPRGGTSASHHQCCFDARR